MDYLRRHRLAEVSLPLGWRVWNAALLLEDEAG